MSLAQEIQLQIRGMPEQEPDHGENGVAAKSAERRQRLEKRGVRWWLMVMVDMLMVLCGQTVATLLGRLYYNSGGDSKWMSTLTQSGGWPLVAVLLLLTPADPVGEPQPPLAKMAPVYLGIGTLIGFDNLMYAYALQYLPVSTFALVAATQLAFNSITSRLINAQRFTALIANSVVVLTFSAALLGVGSSSDGTSSAADLPKGKYTLGFVLTLAASAVFALILSLFEVTFEKVVGGRTFRWVLRVQMCTNAVAATVAVGGLLASGEWRTIPAEMAAYKDGRARYVATLMGTAVSWQAMSVATLRLITRVSSLFANVTGTVSLPLVPVFAVVLFGDKMTGIKAVAMLMAVWGFLSYVYQHYLDGRAAAMREAAGGGAAAETECCVCAAAARAGGDDALSLA